VGIETQPASGSAIADLLDSPRAARVGKSTLSVVAHFAGQQAEACSQTVSQATRELSGSMLKQAIENGIMI